MITKAPGAIPLSDQRPTHVRYWVVVFAVALAIFSYIDRVALSRAAGTISKELALSKEQMGWVFFAFASAYAAFEIPSGYMGDRWGPRRVLTRIVAWWSFFTAATGWAFNFPSLFITQFLFGAGEAGCFPNITRALATWLPHEERVRAQAIVWLSARWGGAFTPLVVVLLFRFVSWRLSFAMLGMLGAIWAIFFYVWFRDRPSDNPRVNAAELALMTGTIPSLGHSAIPWGKFTRSKQVWLLCAQYFCLSFGWYFYITWLPTFLDERLKLTLNQGAIYGILPLFLGGLGSLFCGFVYARLTRLMGSVAIARKLLAYAGFSGAGCLLIVASLLHEPLAVMLALGFASFCNDLVMPTSWGTCMDVGGNLAGTLSGTMNMMGNFGGALYPVVTGYLLRQFNGNWNVPLYVSAAVYFCGILLWLTLDPVTPLETAEITAAAA
ncbi:MAG: MFS transporter [Acidobacteriaceae bacterium]|nr:MFS transporter [Acidobacteriaceae bacterium]